MHQGTCFGHAFSLMQRDYSWAILPWMPKSRSLWLGASIELGGDSLEEMRPRFLALRAATLNQLPMDNVPRVLWESA